MTGLEPAMPPPLTVADTLAWTPGQRTAELGPWVLLGRPLAEHPDAWAFRTRSMDSACVETATGGTLLAHLDDLVLPVRKRRSTQFATTVLIGRAASNDIVLSHSSVSKLHARIELGSTLTIADAGSSNGTTVDGKALTPNERLAVRSEMLVMFGDCRFQIIAADDLARLLKRCEALPR